jgi:hypothetical protein
MRGVNADCPERPQICVQTLSTGGSVPGRSKRIGRHQLDDSRHVIGLGFPQDNRGVCDEKSCELRHSVKLAREGAAKPKQAASVAQRDRLPNDVNLGVGGRDLLSSPSQTRYAAGFAMSARHANTETTRLPPTGSSVVEPMSAQTTRTAPPPTRGLRGFAARRQPGRHWTRPTHQSEPKPGWFRRRHRGALGPAETFARQPSVARSVRSVVSIVLSL